MYSVGPNSSQPVLMFESVTKTFALQRRIRHILTRRKSEIITPLQNCSLRIGPGERIALVGRSGSGKSTLLRLASGLLLPDQGTIRIFGQDSSTANTGIHPKVGLCQGDTRSFFWRLSGRENLELFGGLSTHDPVSLPTSIVAYAKELMVDHRLDCPFGVLSSGEQQRMALVRMLINTPCVLLLDEITKSLDPESSQIVWATIDRYLEAAPNRALVFASHNMDEVEQRAERVIILDEGKIVFDAPPKGAKDWFAQNSKPTERELAS